MGEHVFCETNWVVDYVAPVLSRSPDAALLYASAQRGEVELHVPAISLVEARKVVRERSPRTDLNAIRAFVKSSRDTGLISASDATATFETLSRFESFTNGERARAPARIEALRSDPVVATFAMDDEMLERSTLLAADPGVALQSFDLAILAAVLVCAERLRAHGTTVSFCTLDSDLQPWDANGTPKAALKSHYDRAGVWVYGDFLRVTPSRPTQWPPMA